MHACIRGAKYAKDASDVTLCSGVMNLAIVCSLISLYPLLILKQHRNVFVRTNQKTLSQGAKVTRLMIHHFFSLKFRVRLSEI